MYRNRTGAVARIRESSFSSAHGKQNGLEPDWRPSGVAGRNARWLAHDASASQAQETNTKRRLSTSALFAGLSPEAELELCDSAIERAFSNRRAIFREDDPIRFVDIVTRGSVKLTQLSPDGGEVILRIERAGSPIDGMGDLSEKVHSTTASAIRDCRLLSWDASVFANFAEKFPVIQRNAIAIMAGRLRFLSESFCDLSTARVPQRLARALLRLTGQDCLAQHEPLGLSREELAQMIGTSLFTASRLLREWAELGIVHVNRGGIVIEDLSALTQLAVDRSGEGPEQSSPDLF